MGNELNTIVHAKGDYGIIKVSARASKKILDMPRRSRGSDDTTVLCKLLKRDK
jgi:hypothetical protein